MNTPQKSPRAPGWRPHGGGVIRQIGREDPGKEGPRLFFQRVPEAKAVKNRVHLDINATPGRRATSPKLEAEVHRLSDLGATVIREHDQLWGPFPEHHFVMADPEGNEFCVQ